MSRSTRPYLKATGLPHPLADEIIASHEPDWRRVVHDLTGPTPTGGSVFGTRSTWHTICFPRWVVIGSTS